MRLSDTIFAELARQLARSRGAVGIVDGPHLFVRRQAQAQMESNEAEGAPRAAVRVLKGILAKNRDQDADGRQARLRPIVRSA